MPRQPTVAEIRLNSITTCLNTAINTYEILADSFKAPFSDAICNTTQSLIKCIQVRLFNKFVITVKLNTMLDCETKQG
jgi:hypothetical protein